MSNVVDFDGITKLESEPDRFLDEAKGKLSAVVIIGWDRDNKEYFLSSLPDGGDVLWLIERAKKKLLDYADT